MKKTITLTMFAAIAALSACVCDKTCNKPAQCDSAKEWTPLFAADLSDADFDKDVWSIDKDGVIRANKDRIIFTKNDFENFELELEFRIEKESNSGIVIYCTDTKKWIPNSIEIQIADSSCEKFGKPMWNCGCIFGHVDSEFDTRLPFGEWQKMRVRAVGQKIDVWLNDKHVSKMDMSEWKDNKLTPNGEAILPWLTLHKKCEMPTKGKIGLQGKHGKATTDYRNVRIRNIL